MKPSAAIWRLALSAVAAAVLFILLANVIRQPVVTPQRSYTADFTDVSGLHLDADVRVRGVRVGKVQSIQLERQHGESIAAIGFTLDRRYGVGTDTRLAVKYQTLTGLRYLDVTDPTEGTAASASLTRIPTSMTRPSFDITALFNGLQPVLVTLSPDQINTFTTNAVAYMTGDGSGLGSMLESIRKLTDFASDRQEVVATLMRNLSQVADAIGGNSKDLVQILTWSNRVLDGALKAIDEFRKSELYGPGFVEPVVRLLANAGFPPIPNSSVRFQLEAAPRSGDDLPTNVDDALDRAFTNVDDYIDAFRMLPVVWENIPEPPEEGGTPLPCSKGRFEMPAAMDILVNGQKVVLCNQ